MYKKGHTNRAYGVMVWSVLFFTVGITHALEGPVFTVRTGQEQARFVVLKKFNHAAILDRETELIWERTPSAQGAGWTHAPLLCATKTVGGQRGWRLPSFLELMTLVDPSGEGYAAGTVLPTGHPFHGVQPDTYWTETTSSRNDRQAYAVDFVAGDLTTQNKSRISYYWCVRGGIEDLPSSTSLHVSESL